MSIHQGNAPLLGLIVAMGIAFLIAPRSFSLWAAYQEEKSNTVTATQLATVTDAAKHYIKDHFASLQSQTQAGAPAMVSMTNLLSGGYLPQNFGKNRHAQSYFAAVVKNPSFNNELQAFVLSSGGTPFDYKSLRQISQAVPNKMGGYIWPNNQANGADGGWKIDLAQLGITASLGYLVTWLPSDSIGGDSQDGDRLYRFAVNGRPDLNTLHTDLNMGGNSINHVDSINAKTGHFDDRLTTNEYVNLTKVVIEGQACSPDGLLSRDSIGAILSCQGGKWQGNGGFHAKNCKWIDLPGGGNGHDGRYGQSCPVGFYVNGVSNWRGDDWARTGELQIQCCQ